MKFKSVLLVFAFTLVANNVLLSKQTDNNYKHTLSLVIGMMHGNVVTHTVLKGETVYSIAAAYNTTVQEIYKLNPNAEKGIKEGSVLQIPQDRRPSGYSNHLIEAKETLYSVSKMYNISVEEIKKANPGLDENTFKIGRTIRIPVFNDSVSKNDSYASPFLEHKVVKGETLYSVSKIYDVPVEALLKGNPSLSDGLKEGMVLSIPQKQIQPVRRNNLSEQITSSVSPKDHVIRIGILFPFLEERGNIQKDKMIEYYEGFLLAVKELKEKGLNAEIYTFNIGSEKDTKRLESLLGTSELNNLNLIIGGISKPQIDILTRFSKKTGVPYLVPFESRNTNVEANPTVFQITTSHSSLYQDIITAFISKFGKSNIIFVSERGSNNDKDDFVSELKKELTKWNIPFKTTAGTENLSGDIESLLSSSSKNILIPTSSTEATLRRITAALKASSNQSKITLFGYPEWQTYLQLTADLYQFDSYIYSIFFVDEQQREVVNFNNEYKKWYNVGLINSFPKYGLLGYDAGLFFLTALNKYGSGFEVNIPQLKVPTLQSAIHFDRIDNKGGFINNGIYFIHYTPGQTIEKIDISR